MLLARLEIQQESLFESESKGSKKNKETKQKQMFQLKAVRQEEFLLT